MVANNPRVKTKIHVRFATETKKSGSTTVTFLRGRRSEEVALQERWTPEKLSSITETSAG